MIGRLTKKQALRAVLKKLPVLSIKATQENLDLMVGSCSRCSETAALATAYRIGAEEAQREIAARIAAIKTRSP